MAWQLAAVTLLAAPLVALARPILSPVISLGLLALVMIGLGIGFWRRATNLRGHTRAAAELIVDALAKQMAGGEEITAGTSREPRAGSSQPLEPARHLLPGFGDLTSLRLTSGDFAVGKSLASLDLRDQTDATVLVIVRNGENVLLPVGRDVLRAGDLVALAGTPGAVESAKSLLSKG